MRSVTARGATARRPGLYRANKGAHELAFHQGGDRVDIDPLRRQERASVFHVVNSGRLDLDLAKAGATHLLRVFGIAKCSGDATDPQFDVPPDLWRNFAANHDIRYREAAARLQDAVCLGENAVFVAR